MRYWSTEQIVYEENRDYPRERIHGGASPSAHQKVEALEPDDANRVCQTGGRRASLDQKSTMTDV